MLSFTMDINYLTSLRHDHGLRGLHSPLVLAFRALHMMAESKRFESVYCVLKMKRLNSICLPMPSQSNLELLRMLSGKKVLFYVHGTTYKKIYFILTEEVTK